MNLILLISMLFVGQFDQVDDGLPVAIIDSKSILEVFVPEKVEKVVETNEVVPYYVPTYSKVQYNKVVATPNRFGKKYSFGAGTCATSK